MYRRSNRYNKSLSIGKATDIIGVYRRSNKLTTIIDYKNTRKSKKSSSERQSRLQGSHLTPIAGGAAYRQFIYFRSRHAITRRRRIMTRVFGTYIFCLHPVMQWIYNLCFFSGRAWHGTMRHGSDEQDGAGQATQNHVLHRKCLYQVTAKLSFI